MCFKRKLYIGFILFNFRPGSPGYIENDEISWDAKPKWNYPLK